MNFSQSSCAEISTFLEERKKALDLEAAFLPELAADPRKGVQNLFSKYKSWLLKVEQEKARLAGLYRMERQLSARGYQLIAGIDEAGRGPLAGPVVAAAVVLPEKFFLPGLNDSKKISHKKREALYEEIYRQAVAVGVGMAEVEEIDRINILRADYKAMERAVAQLKPEPQYLLIDGNGAPKFSLPYLPVVGGDGLSASIAAASIIAKVTRDRIMEKLDADYPEYGFAQHKGYGTAQHIAALKEHGPTVVHRLSFDIVRQCILENQ